MGVDGSAGSEAALDFACRQAELAHQRVLVLHGTGAERDAAPAAPAASATPDPTREPVPAAVAEAVARARAGHPGVPLETESTDQGAAQALVDASCDAALVVVGSRGLRAYEGMQLGSVSHDVLRRAAAPSASSADGGRSRTTAEDAPWRLR